MKLSLSLVEFDTDVHGPGPKGQSGTNYARTFSVGMKQYEVLIEYDVDLGVVRLVHPSAAIRDEVLVPLERVVRMEPASKKPKPEKAA